MRYNICADMAESERKPNTASLFPLIAFAEKIHATNHYRELEATGSTADNLQPAIDGDTYEAEEVYPADRAGTELQEEMVARRTTDWAWQAAMNTEDRDLGPMFICEVWGYTAVGKASGCCSTCQSPKERFRVFCPGLS